MSTLTEQLMKQVHFLAAASNAFSSQHKQKFTGQQRVLVILNKEDGLIQSQLAEILDIRPSSLAELLKKMEISEDIYRQEDSEDKRIKRVYLTDQGKKKAAQYDFSENHSEAFFTGLTEEEQVQFCEYMDKITFGWSEKFRKQSARFVDPMDRLEAIQTMRQQFEEQLGAGMKNLSSEDMRKMRRRMKKEMRGMHPPFGERMLNEDFGDWPFKKEFREGFWGNPSKEKQEKNDDEWEDF